MKSIIVKHDLKQNLINIYQDFYNNINSELRTLPEMKIQLHCRVFELQQNLWEIADESRKEIETKRQDIIYENWLCSEICMLFNNYLSLVQTEFDRSFETLKLVNDYYMIMLEKTPSTITIRLENLNIERLNVNMLLHTVRKMTDETSPTQDQEENGDNEIRGSNVIANSLVNCSDEQKPLYLINKIVSEKIKDAKQNFDSILNIFCSQCKTELDFQANLNKQGKKATTASSKKKSLIKPIKDKSKQNTSLKFSVTEQEVQGNVSTKEALIEQWLSAINTECERFNFRLDLIQERARENIMEFYCFLESIFCNLHKTILDRYNTEISNINSLCNYLKTAIEEESPLQHSLILGKDKFVVGVKDITEKREDYFLRELKEDFHDCKFTVNQLSCLMDIFKISGPLGVIRKQPLCYILQDLMLLDTYDNHPYLPKTWCSLNEQQLRYVLDDMFGLEFGVDWRDFIIYNLDIPYPEVNDILQVRKQFLSYDLEETELISLEDYNNVKLWFENDLPNSPKQGLRFALVKKLLPEMFKVDGLHINYTALLLYFCKDFDPANGLRKALSLALGKHVITSKSELEMILQNEKEVDQMVSSFLLDIINSIVMTRETAQVYDVIDNFTEVELNPSRASEDSWKSSLFASWKLSGMLKTSEPFFSPLTPPQSLLDCENHKKLPFSFCTDKWWVTRIPVATVLSVLNASFFFQDKRFALKLQYLTCLEEESEPDGMIEAYDLVNFNCIQKLFAMTNKFKIAIPCDVLKVCSHEDYKSQEGSVKHRSTVFNLV